VLNLQGLVLFALYLAGIVSRSAVAWLLKRFWLARQVTTR
jgi:ferrous iron transport protein B